MFALAASAPPGLAQSVADIAPALQGFGTSALPASLTGQSILLIAAVTVLSLAPGIAVMVTCFPFLVTVLSILRQALGLPQAPPNTLIVSLALFLTWYIMEPVFAEAWARGVVPLMDGSLDLPAAAERAVAPFRVFMAGRADPGTVERLAALRPAGAGATWLASAATARELSGKLGFSNTAQLDETIATYNESAVRGQDAQWGRGTKAYSRNNGDARVTPNACVRVLKPPYYGLELELGTMGTLSGLKVDAHGQVMHVQGERIPALYACGNAMANLVEGLWYTSGTSNGRSLIFGVLAARHAMGAD